VIPRRTVYLRAGICLYVVVSSGVPLVAH